MPLRADLDSLLLYDPSRARSTINVWVARPTGPDDASLGKLFLVSAIDSAAHVNHELISLLQEELRASFYQTEPQTLERRFEEAIQATNRRLHAMIADGVNDWVSRCHFLVGAIQGGHLILAPVRSVNAYLLRRSRLHDIIGVTDESAPNPLRIFSQVITGQIEEGDRLLICLPSLLDYFSLEKLRRTMLDHRPSDAARMLEQSLVDVDPSMSFGALLFSFVGEQEIAPVSLPLASNPTNIPPRRYSPQQSMDDLISREKSTERILAPSFGPALQSALAGLFHGLDRLFRTLILRRPPRRALPTASLAEPIRRLPPTSSDIPPTPAGPSITERIGVLNHQLTSFIRQFRLRRQNRESSATHQARPSLVITTIQRIQRITRTQRMIAGAIIVVLIVLTSLLARSGTTPTSSNTPTATASQVETKIAQADAALAYGGEAVAQAALTDATAELAALPNKSKTDRTTHDQLSTKIDNLRLRLAKRTTLTSEMVADLNTVVTGIKPTQLYFIPGMIVASDLAAHLNARLDLNTKGVTKVQPTLDIGSLMTGTVMGTSIAFLTDRPGIVEYAPKTNVWKPFDIALPTDHPTIQAITSFQSRLYVLDRTGNRILRFNRAGATYGTSTSWLKEMANFSTSRGLVVDGSVFVLQSNGVIQLYFGGRKSTFALATIDPVLTDATQIWTGSDTTSLLYVLDPGHQRIVSFDKKTGTLKQQYTSTSWTNLKAFAVDESTKTLYTLNGSTVLRTTLPVIK